MLIYAKVGVGQESKSFADLCCFNMLRRFFSSNRFRFADAGGFVFFRIGLVSIAAVNNFCRRSIAAVLFAICVRWRCEMTLIVPCLLMREESCFDMRFFCVSERLGEFTRSKMSVAFVLTLFTFCPPGPLLREKVKVSSFSGIIMSFLIFVINSLILAFSCCSFYWQSG